MLKNTWRFQSKWLRRNNDRFDKNQKGKMQIILKLHRQFVHTTCQRLKILLQDAGAVDEEYTRLIQETSAKCTMCKNYWKMPSHPNSKPSLGTWGWSCGTSSVSEWWVWRREWKHEHSGHEHGAESPFSDGLWKESHGDQWNAAENLSWSAKLQVDNGTGLDDSCKEFTSDGWESIIPVNWSAGKIPNDPLCWG